MKRFLQYLIGVSTVGLVVALLVCCDGRLVTGQVPGNLPIVDKVEQKPYTEIIKGVYKEDDGKEVKVEAKLDMLPIPGGVFLMGSPDSESGRNADEGPQHPVKVRPFWIGK